MGGGVGCCFMYAVNCVRAIACYLIDADNCVCVIPMHGVVLGAGRLPPGNLMELFKRMPPPLGFGRHCSERLAWINLMKMNPAMDKHGLVSFNSALLSIVRFRLRIHLDSVQGNGYSYLP